MCAKTSSRKSSTKKKVSLDVIPEEGSGSGSDETPLDFLGMYTGPGEPSDESQEYEEVSEDELDDGKSSSETRKTSSPPEDGKSSSETRQTSSPPPRKQTHPKKRNLVREEIIRLQNSTNLLIPRLPFQRVVREILQNVNASAMRLQGMALECLRESSEDYLVQLFEDANLMSYHRSRVTVDVKDVRLVQVIRGSKDPGRSH